MSTVLHRSTNPDLRSQHGFTLIELMITVAVAGILMSVGVPAYKDYITRSKLTEAATTLSDMKVKLEQYFQDNRSYVGACAANTLAPLPSNLKYFTVSCPTLTASTFQVQASSTFTPAFTFTITQDNTKATTVAPTGWPTSTSCWVNNKNGCN